MTNKTIYIDLIIAEQRLTCTISLYEGEILFKNILPPYTNLLEVPLDKIKHIIHLHEKTPKGQICFFIDKYEEDLHIYSLNKYEVFPLFKKIPIYGVSSLQFYEESGLNDLPKFYYQKSDKDLARIGDNFTLLPQLLPFLDEKILFSSNVISIRDMNSNDVLILMDSSLFLFTKDTLFHRIHYKNINCVFYHNQEIGIILIEGYDLHMYCENTSALLEVFKSLKVCVKNKELKNLNVKMSFEDKQLFKNTRNPTYVRNLLKESQKDDIFYALELGRACYLENESVYKEALEYSKIYEESRNIVVKWEKNKFKFNIFKMKKYLEIAKNNRVLGGEFYETKFKVLNEYSTDTDNEMYIKSQIRRCIKYFDLERLKHYVSKIDKQSDYKNHLLELEGLRRTFTFEDIKDDYTIQISQSGLHERRCKNVILYVDAFDKLGYNYLSKKITLEEDIYKTTMKELTNLCRSQQTHYVFTIEVPDHERLFSSIFSFKILSKETTISNFVYELKTQDNQFIFTVLSRDMKLSSDLSNYIWDGKYNQTDPKWKMICFGKKFNDQKSADSLRNVLGIFHPYSSFIIKVLALKHYYNSPFIYIDYNNSKYRIVKKDFKNASFKYDLGENLYEITISLFDQTNEFLGEVKIKLEDLFYTSGWYKLQPNPDYSTVPQGEIQLEFELVI